MILTLVALIFRFFYIFLRSSHDRSLFSLFCVIEAVILDLRLFKHSDFIYSSFYAMSCCFWYFLENSLSYSGVLNCNVISMTSISNRSDFMLSLTLPILPSTTTNGKDGFICSFNSLCFSVRFRNPIPGIFTWFTCNLI
jgi:hypothetical protein